MTQEEREKLIQEGRNQVLYLLLCIGDESVAHDHYLPEKADILLEARREIVIRFKHPRTDGRGVLNTIWPQDGDWPDFEEYTYRPG